MKLIIYSIHRIAAVLFVVGILTLGTFNVYAQEETTTQSSDTKNIKTQQFSGEVTKIEGNKITVTTDEGTKEVTVPNNIKVSKNTMEATVRELQTNDEVTITQTEQGEVLGVDAISGSVSDYSKISLPIVIGILLLLGVLYMLWNKSQQGHIKTETTNIQ